MRPPKFTGGNPRTSTSSFEPRGTRCFNEAAEIHRRKQTVSKVGPRVRRDSFRFNEAAGIHRRKLADLTTTV